MTHAWALRGWFDKTGMFSTMNESPAVPGISVSLDGLLKVNMLPAGYVCLLTKGRMVKPGNPSLWGGADHWVVMADGSGNNKVTIQTKSGLQTPTPLGSEQVTQYPDAVPFIDPIKRKIREELEDGTLDFPVYTWGEILKIDQKHGFHLPVKKFLGDFFGFVFARRK